MTRHIHDIEIQSMRYGKNIQLMISTRKMYEGKHMMFFLI